MKHVLLALLLVAALFVAVSGNPIQAGEPKVVICHRPPGNPYNPVTNPGGNQQTLTVGASAAQAHKEQHPDDCVLAPEPCVCHVE
jgi:hypothetical protein